MIEDYKAGDTIKINTPKGMIKIHVPWYSFLMPWRYKKIKPISQADINAVTAKGVEIMAALLRDRKEFWSFEYDGEINDTDQLTQKDALEAAEGAFIQQCCDDNICENEDREIKLVRFYYKPDGEREILESKTAYIEFVYEPEASYADENGTWNKACSGVR